MFPPSLDLTLNDAQEYLLIWLEQFHLQAGSCKLDWYDERKRKFIHKIDFSCSINLYLFAHEVKILVTFLDPWSLIKKHQYRFPQLVSPTQHHPGLTVPFQNVGRLFGVRFGTSGAWTSPLVIIFRTFFIIIFNTLGYFPTRFEVSFGSVFRLNRKRRFDFLAWNIDCANMDLVCFLWTWDFIPSG